jgi:hypothetical protein
MFMECFSEVYGCMPELTDEFYRNLACKIDLALTMVNTCRFGVENYYIAVCLATASIIEQQQLHQMARDSMYSAIAHGNDFKVPEIGLYSGYYGSLLKELEKKTPLIPNYVGG